MAVGVLTACSGSSNKATATKGALILHTAGSLSACVKDVEAVAAAASDQYEGFAVDLLRDVSAGLGLSLVVKAATAAAPAGIPVGCDLLVTDPSTEPTTGVAFSAAYLPADEALLVRKADETIYTSLDELSERNVGVVGKNEAAMAPAKLPKDTALQPFPDAASAVKALEDRKVVAVAMSWPAAAHRVHQAPTIYAIAATVPTGRSFRFVVAAESKVLLTALTGGLEKAQASGAQDAAYKTWFGPKR